MVNARLSKALLIAGLALGAATSLATTAQAQEWRDRREMEHREHEREWREHEWHDRRYYAPPPVVYAPPAPIYAPPPVYAGPPGINLILPIHIR